MKISRGEVKGINFERITFVKHQTMLKLHSHNTYELYYLLEGSRKYFIDSSLLQLEQGDLLIIPPGILHKSVGDADGLYSRILINARPDVFNKNILNGFLTQNAGSIWQIPSNRRLHFETLLEKIEYETIKKDEHSEYLVNAYLNELLIFLIRVNNGAEFVSISNETDRTIGEAIKYIRENYDKHINLDILSEYVNVSKTYFCKVFKKKIGEGYSDYITKVRINEAKKLLVKTDLTVTQIALKCGYNDSSYFTSSFKKMIGITPVKCRNSNLQ